jgi:hypothetical protein
MKSSDSQWMQRAIDDLPLHYRETLLPCDEMSYQGDIVDPIWEKSRAPEFGQSLGIVAPKPENPHTAFAVAPPPN